MAKSDAAWNRLLAQFSALGVTFTEQEKTALRTLADKPDMTDSDVVAAVRTDATTFKTFAARFPGISNLINSGRVNNESEFVSFERRYFSLINEAGITAFDSSKAQKTADLLNSDVSVDEVDARIRAAKNLIDTTSKTIRDSLKSTYGIDLGDQLAFVLDPKSVKPILDAKAEEAIRKADLAARAVQYGINLTAGELDKVTGQTAGILGSYRMGYNGSVGAVQNDATIRDAVQTAKMNLSQDELLAAIDYQKSNDRSLQETLSGIDVQSVLAAFGDKNAALASARRRQREKDRFSGQSGIGQSSLAVQRNI